MSEEIKKLVYVLHDGGEHAEKVLTAFTMANIGVTMENDVTMMLFGEATRLAYKGYAETIQAPSRLPMDRLIRDFLDIGGKIYIGRPCLKARNVDPATMLIEGVETPTGTEINDLFTNSDQVIGW